MNSFNSIEKPLLPQPAPELVRAITERKCVLLVGSGLSKNTHGLPTWNELIEQLYIKFNPSAKEVPREIIDYRLEFLDAKKTQAAAELNRHLEDILTVQEAPTEIEVLLCKLSWAAIITTNLDELIESAFKFIGEEFIVVESERDIASIGQQNGLLILKMHGSLHSKDGQVLTFSDYQEFDLNRHAMKAMVVSLFSQYPVLIIGAGLADPDFTKLSEIVYNSLKGFKQRCYYVSEPLPGFVKSVWQARNFEFIEVRNEDLRAWVFNLYDAVEKCRPHAADVVNAFAKRNALIELSSATSDYEILQDKYLATIHIPDYTLFTRPWEQTLYEPLRARVSKILQSRTDGAAFAYIGPGPHAPLFASPSRALIARKMEKLCLVDISKKVLEGCKNQLCNAGPKIDSFQLDISAGSGGRLAQELMHRLRSSKNLTELDASIDPEKLIAKIVSASNMHEADILFPEVEFHDKFDIVYSEMVASFTGTAPLMAFDTTLRMRYSTEIGREGGRESFERICLKGLRLWQTYNDRVYELQLRAMLPLLRPTGILIVATDVEKKFDDSSVSSVYSFTTRGLPRISTDGLRLRKLDEELMFWRDHRFNLLTEIGGTNVNYFLAHTHRIAIAEYEKG
jgi:SIR2-like domain